MNRLYIHEGLGRQNRWHCWARSFSEILRSENSASTRFDWPSWDWSGYKGYVLTLPTSPSSRSSSAHTDCEHVRCCWPCNWPKTWRGCQLNQVREAALPALTANTSGVVDIALLAELPLHEFDLAWPNTWRGSPRPKSSDNTMWKLSPFVEVSRQCKLLNWRLCSSVWDADDGAFWTFGSR